MINRKFIWYPSILIGVGVGKTNDKHYAPEQAGGTAKASRRASPSRQHGFFDCSQGPAKSRFMEAMGLLRSGNEAGDHDFG